MPQKTKPLQTNFTAGELSPRLEGRPDLASYFNGARQVQNAVIWPQGGFTRRFGTRKVQEVKDSTQNAYLMPFQFSVTDAYMLEYGEDYARFFKDGAALENPPGTPIEVVTPYSVADLADVQTRQSADVMYHTQPLHQPRKLQRLSDTEWFFNLVNFRPYPSVEEDKTFAATLTPGATTGTGVTFTASAAVFLSNTPNDEASDVGKQIISGVSKAVITATVSDTVVTADIIDDFADTDPIAAGDWALRGSPRARLDVRDKGPVETITKCQANVAAFRSDDVGKYLIVYGGVIQINEFISDQEVNGQILSELTDSDKDNPPQTELGTWTLEIPAWSTTRGWPECIEFHEGRLGFGGNRLEPTTWWLSSTDDFENFARGPLATDAVFYTVASRQVNVLEWMISDTFLFLGTAKNEHTAKGAGLDEPLGGDVIPAVRPAGNEGAASIQAQEVLNGSLFISKSRRRVSALRHTGGDLELPEDMTLVSEHLFTTPVAQTRMAYAQDPDYQVYVVREDGVLLVLTYRPSEEVSAWARWVTDGAVESVAVQRHPDGDRDQVWLIVNRTIDGATKRYIEVVEDRMAAYASEPVSNQGLQFDCATLLTGVTDPVITGLEYLEGKTVGIKQDGYDRGDKTVSGGTVTLDDTLEGGSTVELGLRYTMVVETMRPGVEGTSIEGVPRSWDKVLLRVQDTKGGTLNGEALSYSKDGLFTGNLLVEGIGWSRDGYVEIRQDQAYPMSVVMFAGELSYGDRMGGDYDP